MANKILLGSLLALLAVPSAFAGGGTFADFPYADASDLKPFARDLGGIVGSGTSQTARVLGFGGFDISARAVSQFEPSASDKILRKNKPFGFGWAQAEIGMPFRIDGFVKAGTFSNMTLAGGGLKYGFTQPQPRRLQVMLVAGADMISHRYFYASHFSSNLIMSLNMPVFAPYIGAGVDNTILTGQYMLDPANPAVISSLAGHRVSVVEPKYTAGFKMTFLTYGYLSAGYTYTHGSSLVNAGMGFRV